MLELLLDALPPALALFLRRLEQIAELDGVRPVSVMDREADVFALFAEQRRLGTVDLLVRAKHNRSLGKDVPKLFETMREETEPEGSERLEWFLLTTLAVESRQDAERVLEWYRLRWRIEDWHRVLKSGCKVEYLAHRTGERIERAMTINAVIAWRLAAMTLLGRDTPELPAGTLFSDIEIAALEDFAQDRKLPPPDNVGRAVLTTAMLGGDLNFQRKRYAGPGHPMAFA